MHERHRFGHLRSCLLATALTAFPLAAQAGDVLPTGGNYVAGKGTIAGASSGLTINQSSTTGIIDWSSFSIGQGNAVQFNNGSGATLNRVTGPDMARIGGSLTATGSIFLIDPQGVVISNTGRVVTGGSFVGSTRDISNSDFLSGKMHFTGSSSGNVVNGGQIRSTGGDAVLIGNSVQNTGTLSAPRGTAGMAAGNDVLLQPVGGDQRIFVKGGKGDVRNSGAVSAAAAELKAAGGNVYSLAGNNGGIINATGTQTINGHVWLTSNTGNVSVGGNISAKNANGTGGAVTVRGTNIDVSGGIDASATAAGRNGGDVSIIATQTTNVGGTIKAGGGQGAKGGFVETSGAHVHVADSARIDTLSLGGASGTWLIDPTDFVIAASGGDITGAALSASLGTTDVTFSSNDGGSGTNGDIFVNDAVSWSSGQTLTLTALRNIEVNAGITVGGTGTLVLTAADAIAINHTVQVTGAGQIALNAGLDTATVPGASLLELSFGNGASIDYGATDNGGTLGINATSYTLLYKLADGANTAPDSGTDDIAGIDATDDSGYYALATNLDGTGTTFTSALAGAGANLFAGTFEGLGNTITGLTINDTGVSHNVGLFGKTSAATIRDIGLIGGSITAGVNASAGGLVGENFGGSGVAIIANAYNTGSVVSDHFTGGYHGVGGLVGLNHAGSGGVAAIVNSYSTGAITGNGFNNVGGLLGFNYADGGTATVTQSFATGNAQGGDGANVGGLVGTTIGGLLSNVYATGSVTAGNGGAWTGGLIGYNSGGGSVSDAYATGAVTTGADSGSAGGFVGFSDSGTITDAYATGAVSVGSSSTGGGFAGYSGGTVTNAYWDTLTSGQSSDGAQATGSGSINGFDPATGSIGLTTAQLQGLHTLSGGGLFDIATAFANPLWGGGSAGLYPYLLFQFPSGTPQAIGGIAYSDAGVTPLSAGNTVSAFMNGAVLNSALTGGTVTTGANGYYYYLLAPGTLANSQVLTTTASGAALGEDTSATLSNFNIFGGALNDFTSVDSYATELSERAANLATAEGGDPSLTSFIAGLSGFYLTSTAPSFSIDTAPDLSSDIFISDNAPGGVLSVDVPVSWSSASALTLGAYEIDINSNIHIGGAGSLALNTCGCDNYKLANGVSIDFGPVNNGGSFAVDGTAYTLLYNMADVQAINTDDTSLQGNYALATALDATSTSGWVPIGTDGSGVAGNGGVGFAGEFAGLGNTISNLTVDLGGNDYAGLFGFSAGTIRDVGLVGGSVAGRIGVGGVVGFNFGGTLISDYSTATVLGLAATGGLAGINSGSVTNSHATGQVTGFNDIGGLLGESINGNVSNSYATGDVIGASAATINSLIPGSTASGTPVDIGGLIGSVGSGTISNSYATGSVTADDGEAIGGLIGLTNGNGPVLVDGSYATGNVTADIVAFQGGLGVGGLIGENGGQVTNSYATGNVLGQFRVGGLIGENSDDAVGNDGSLTNVYATGSVTAVINTAFGLYGLDAGGLVGDNSGTILNAFATGDVSGGEWVGGFVGMNESLVSISEAYASGNVTSPYNPGATGMQVGGFAGESDGDILDAYALGSVTGSDQVGGFVGQNGGGTVTNAYSIGAVTLASGAPTPTQMGGFAGYNQGTVTAGFYDTDINPLISAIGDGNLSGVTGLTTAQFFDSANLVGFTFDTTPGGPGWVIIDDDGTFNNASGIGLTMPMLLMEHSTTIINAHQLQLMALDLAADYTVANDIDLSKTDPANGQDVWGPAGFASIGNFSDPYVGTFEGNNHTLDGLTINATANALDAGLFGDITGTVQNVNLTNVSMTQSGASSYLGGIAGENDGTITNATVSGTLTGGDFTGVGGIAGINTNFIINSISSADVSAGDQGIVGGLVGFNVGEIDTSSASGAVSDTGDLVFAGGLAGANFGVVSQSSATGTVDVTGDAGEAGGLLGENDGVVSQSFATGQVSMTDLSLTPFGNDAGGLVGNNTGGSLITDSYATGAVIAIGDNAYAGGLVGDQCSCSNIEHSYATGNVSVTGTGAVAGGFAGHNEGIIDQSYATGVVTVTDTYGTSEDDVGGLVGVNDGGNISQSFALGSATVIGTGVSFGGGLVGVNATGGDISDSYAMGPVTAYYAGGFVGENEGTIETSYSIGVPTGHATPGGFVGIDVSAGGITTSYWDAETSGVATDVAAIGKTTAQLQASLASLGFDNTIWGLSPGSFPYLLWQYPDGTAQVVSGTAYSDVGVTPLAAGAVSLLVNGTASGTAFTGANGYYYFLLAPGSIPPADDDVLAYLQGTGGAALAQNPGGSVAGLDILNGYLSTSTSLTTYSDFNAALTYSLATATGSYSSVLSLVNALPGLAIDATGASFVIDQAVNRGAGALGIKNNGGTVTQSAAITAHQLWLQGTSNFTLTNAGNAIDRLAADVGGISLTDNATLSVNTVGATNGVTSSGALSLTTIGSGHNLGIYSALTGNIVNLVSAGTLNQNSTGIITATTLKGSSNGGVSLTTAANAITNLGAFSTANHSFALSNAHTLAVTGAVDVGSGGMLALTTTGAGHNLSVYGSLTGGTVNLVSAGTLNQNSAGIITATTLKGSSDGGVMLTTAANAITNLGDFSTANHSFALSDTRTLTVTGAVDAGSGGILALTTTGTGHNLAVNNTLTGGIINLVSAGSINQNSAGILTGAILMGSAAGDVTLTAAANAISTLNAFSTADHNFALSDAATLTVNGAVNAGAGNLALTTTGAGHNLVVYGALTGNIVTLVSGGTLNQNSAGVITAATLKGSSNGNVTLTAAANSIANLGAFSTADYNFALSDAATLTVNGAVNTGAGNLTLTTTGGGHNLSVYGALTGNIVNLVSAGTLNQSSAGIITAATLKGSSNGGVVLTTAANSITNLGAFSTANHSFALSDAATLAVTSAIDVGSANILALTTTGAGHNLSVYGSLTGGTVNLVSAGTLNQNSAGVITATTLTGSSNGGVSLVAAANVITNLGAFSTADHSFALSDANTLKVTGAVDVGSASILALTTTGAGHNLAINNTLTGGTINLASAGSISQNSAGILTGAILTGTAAGNVTLTAAANKIANLSDFTLSAGNFSFSNAQALNVTGTVQATAPSATLSLLTTSGNLYIGPTGFLTAATVNLTAAAQALESSAGRIDTNLINVAADTGINLIGSANNITNIGTNHTNSGPDVIIQ